jgi:hypothetical protein
LVMARKPCTAGERNQARPSHGGTRPSNGSTKTGA